MRYRNRIAAMLMCILLLCGLHVTLYAQEPQETKGKITVKMKYDGKAVTGGALTVYRVGDAAEENGDFTFFKTDAMGGFSEEFDDISDPKLAEDVAAFVEAKDLSAYAEAENQEGKAVFTNLDLGLYLIVQTESSDGYEPLKPFLVSVPMNENGHYIYEVNAEGKIQHPQGQNPSVPFDPNDPSNPNGPSDPNAPSNPNAPGNPNASSDPTEEPLPQTGQLNWPIPMLAASGLLLFAVGWLLRFGRKKDRNAA